jgi:hypothetical protein
MRLAHNGLLHALCLDLPIVILLHGFLSETMEKIKALSKKDRSFSNTFTITGFVILEK